MSDRLARVSLLALGAIGGAAVSAGSLLPWLTAFAGLQSLAAATGLWGKTLLAVGVLAATLAVLAAARPGRAARAALAVSGGGATLLAGYLLSRSLAAIRASDPVLVLRPGPGGWVALAGALAVTATAALPGAAARGDTTSAPATTLSTIAGSRPSNGSPARAALALTLAVTLGTSGAVHLAVVREHLGEWWLYAVFFAVLGAAQLLMAAAVALGAGPRLLLASAAVNALVVLLWVVTRTTGLPVGPDPWIPEATGPLDVLATAAEVAASGLALVLLRTRRSALAM